MRGFTIVVVVFFAVLGGPIAYGASLFDLPGLSVELTPIHTGSTFSQAGTLADMLSGDPARRLQIESNNPGVAGGGQAGIQVEVISLIPFQLASASAQFSAWVEQDFGGSPSVSRVVYARFEVHSAGGTWQTLTEARNEHHQSNPGRTETGGTLMWADPTGLDGLDILRFLIIAEGGVFDTNRDPTTIRHVESSVLQAFLVPSHRHWPWADLERRESL